MKKIIKLRLFGSALLPLVAFAQSAGVSASPQPAIENRAPQSPLGNCLPAAIKLSDVVEVVTTAGNANAPSAGPQKITVEQKLNELKATCGSENKLVDRNGRPIVFVRLIGCWGYPPPNYRELLQKQREEIDSLKKQNTVIEMTCNPSGVHISSLTCKSASLPS